jgi:hypothetical protein
MKIVRPGAVRPIIITDIDLSKVSGGVFGCQAHFGQNTPVRDPSHVDTTSSDAGSPNASSGGGGDPHYDAAAGVCWAGNTCG